MVAPATRQAVLDAVEAVGFVPNRSARQLVSGRAGAVGVIVPDITNPYFSTILQAIQAGARGHDLGVLIADTGADADVERQALARLGRQVDGLVVLTPVTDLSSATVPTVQVNRQSRLAPSVVVDQAAVVTIAVDHLANLGHRHLAVVRGPASYWSTTRRDRRSIDWRQHAGARYTSTRSDRSRPASTVVDRSSTPSPRRERPGSSRSTTCRRRASSSPRGMPASRFPAMSRWWVPTASNWRR